MSILTPNANTLCSVDLPMLREAYNAEDGIHGGNTTVLCETPTSFIVENIIPVRDHNHITFVDNPPRHSSIQYELPKKILFNVPAANNIPSLANFRVRCPELDDAFGFTGASATFYYLFGHNERIDLDSKFQGKYSFQLSDPMEAIDILVIATIDQWHASPSIGDWFRETQSLVDSVCNQHVGGRADPYMGDFEFYGITKFHLPHFTAQTSYGTEKPDDTAFNNEIHQRIDALRKICQGRWEYHLSNLEQKAVSLENYIASLEAQADGFEAQARNLREEANQLKKQLQRKTAQPA